MRQHLRLIGQAAALILLVTGSAISAPATDTRARSAIIFTPAFTDAERQVIREYFATHNFDNTATAPALKIKAALPTEAHRRALPRELMIALPARDSRYARSLVGGQVILLDRLTGIVVDIISRPAANQLDPHT